MLDRIAALPISEWIATSEWSYPLLLSVHTMGLAIVVGIMVMLDLRLLGAARGLPLSTFERLVPLAWAGFLLNLVSGVLLFMSLAPRLATNWPFLSKMGAILLAGAISWLLWRSARADMAAADTNAPALDSNGGAIAYPLDGVQFSPRTRTLAILSLLTWFAAILFGRLIAYVLDAAMLAGDF